jgi:cobalt-zinc-cadmium resistance protein CzcA
MGQRCIVVLCNITGCDIGGFVNSQERSTPPSNFRPATMTWGGQFENQQRAAKPLRQKPITIAAIFPLLFVIWPG